MNNDAILYICILLYIFIYSLIIKLLVTYYRIKQRLQLITYFSIFMSIPYVLIFIFLCTIFFELEKNRPTITIDEIVKGNYENYLIAMDENSKNHILPFLALLILSISNPVIIWAIAISLKIKYNVKKYDIYPFSSVDLKEKLLK